MADFLHFNTKYTNIQYTMDGPAKKRLCVEIRDDCIIHCTEASGDLSSLQDTQSWKTLLKAAEIRQYTPILELTKTVKGEERPNIMYHCKCRSNFTMKRDLDNICKEKNQSNESFTTERILAGREPPTESTTYKRVSLFCEKVSKYVKGNDVREKLIQCIDLRADGNIRKTALARNDGKMLAIVSRDLVAVEACYHGTCHREYTRPRRETSTTSTSSFIPSDDEYAHIESAA